MVQGIGVDIVKLERVEAVHRRFGDRFARKVLSAEELAAGGKQRGVCCGALGGQRFGVRSGQFVLVTCSSPPGEAKMAPETDWKEGRRDQGACLSRASPGLAAA